MGILLLERCWNQHKYILYAESFHHVLKHVYMKGNINKCLDSVIHLLMKYTRDKAFDRIMKAEKG